MPVVARWRVRDQNRSHTSEVQQSAYHSKMDFVQDSLAMQIAYFAGLPQLRAGPLSWVDKVPSEGGYPGVVTVLTQGMEMAQESEGAVGRVEPPDGPQTRVG